MVKSRGNMWWPTLEGTFQVFTSILAWSISPRRYGVGLIPPSSNLACLLLSLTVWKFYNMMHVSTPIWGRDIWTVNLLGGQWCWDDLRLPIFFTTFCTIFRLFDLYRLILSTDIDPEPELIFYLTKLVHFWMWLDEEAKIGLMLHVYHKFFALCGSSG